jgi:hypothetical protein
MKKTLASTNKYLSNPAKRAEMIRRSVASLTAVEGVHIKRYKVTLRKHRAKLLKKNILILTV